MKNGHKMGQMASKLKNKTTFIFWTSTVWENKASLVFSFFGFKIKMCPKSGLNGFGWKK